MARSVEVRRRSRGVALGLALQVGMFLGIASNTAMAQRSSQSDEDADGLQKRAQRVRPTEALRKSLAKLRERQTKVRGARASLRSVAAYEPRGRISKQDLATWKKLVAIWKREARQIDETSAAWKKKLDAFEGRLQRIDASPSKAKLVAAQKALKQLNRSFSLQYLQMQQKMQQENREFTMLSNVLKQKHDTAKAAINNIR